MSSLPQGTPGPSGRTGFQPSPMQLLGGNYAVSTSTTTQRNTRRRRQSNRFLTKLTVGMLVDLFYRIRADYLPSDASALSKH